jgi:hypothetical protein
MGVMEYVDIKKNPEMIPHIRELRNQRKLQEFVADVNKKTSLFRTLRCEKPCSCASGNNRFPLTAHWHFTFAFEILDQNYRECYEILNQRIGEFMTKEAQNCNVEIDLRMIPTSYRDHGVTLWSQDLEIYGLGRTKEVALNQFRNGLDLTQKFFSRESLLFTEELNKGRITIS